MILLAFLQGLHRLVQIHKLLGHIAHHLCHGQMVLCVHQNDVYRHRIAFGLLLQHFGLGIVGFYHGLIGGSQMLAGTFKISLLAAINGMLPYLRS